MQEPAPRRRAVDRGRLVSSGGIVCAGYVTTTNGKEPTLVTMNDAMM